MALFRPAILDSFSGYSRGQLYCDVLAGITVGIIALPLAMAFAIASGLKPEAGIFAAIIGGLIVAVFGGTKVQIAGPAGAFIVIVYAIVDRYGVANLLLATTLSGIFLFLWDSRISEIRVFRRVLFRFRSKAISMTSAKMVTR